MSFFFSIIINIAISLLSHINIIIIALSLFRYIIRTTTTTLVKFSLRCRIIVLLLLLHILFLISIHFFVFSLNNLLITSRSIIIIGMTTTTLIPFEYYALHIVGLLLIE